MVDKKQRDKQHGKKNYNGIAIIVVKIEFYRAWRQQTSGLFSRSYEFQLFSSFIFQCFLCDASISEQQDIDQIKRGIYNNSTYSKAYHN